MMENFSRTIEKVRTTKFTVTEKGAIKQTERNLLKQEVLTSILADLPEDITIGLTKKGIALRLPNDTEGSIPVVLDIVFKNLDTDLEGLVDEKTKAIQDAADRKKKQRLKVERAKAEREAKKTKED